MLNAIFHRISRSFRSNRMAKFEQEMALRPGTRVLDVGGRPDTWTRLRTQPKLVILNTPHEEELLHGYQYVAGDGCALPFRDQEFDIVFSNSVIEHVGSAENQRRFAAEIARVGKRYWVQTPNRYFPVEQHILTPFIHLLPKSWQTRIALRFTVWSMLTDAGAPEREWYIRHFLYDLRLLSASELSPLFPGAKIVRERFCGAVKSLIAVR